MAVRKIQIRPPDNNYADVLHPETDTTMVLLPDGSVLQDQLVAPLASGSATALVIDMPGITSYTHGKLFQFIASANNNEAASTLKVGTLPARPIYLEGTTNKAPNLIAGKLYTVWADNTKNCFFLKASGSGNAVAADLLVGKTATTDLGNIVGTMPHNGSQNATLTITGSAKPTKVIPAGYTWGGTITAQVDPSQAGNIKKGVTLGGVEGTLMPFARESGTVSIQYVHKEDYGGEELTPSSITVSNLPFAPKTIIIEMLNDYWFKRSTYGYGELIRADLYFGPETTVKSMYHNHEYYPNYLKTFTISISRGPDGFTMSFSVSGRPSLNEYRDTLNLRWTAMSY
jgi:hypothetical protein